MRTALKYVLVTVLSFPVAVFFTGDIGMCIGPQDVPFIDQIVIASFLVSWGIVTYWATRVSSIRGASARTCRAFALAAFLLPVASIVYWVTEPPREGPIIIPTWFGVIVFIVFGPIMGFLGLIGSRILSPDGAKAPN